MTPGCPVRPVAVGCGRYLRAACPGLIVCVSGVGPLRLRAHYRDLEDLSIKEIARRLGRAEATVKAYLYDPTGVTKDQVLMTDRVSERRRAAQLARHYRDQEGLTIAEIARRLGRAEGTVKAYLYDPIGDKAREVKARYRGVSRGCGAPTSARNGKGDAYAYCKRCRPGAIVRQWTREGVRGAMRAWRARYGAAPSSYDWSRTHALRRGGEALERVQAGEWPAPSTVIDLYGSWAAGVADAFGGA